MGSILRSVVVNCCQRALAQNSIKDSKCIKIEYIYNGALRQDASLMLDIHSHFLRQIPPK